MQIVNVTKNTILATKVVMAAGILARIKGLLGKRSFLAGEALVLRPCNSIHTFLMRFPIDVLFINRNNYVVGSISAMKPSRISRILFAATFVIELPIGTIQSSKTSKGDLISFL
jgi:uncharacterized membrane protein (UPF0127 family)